MFIICLTIAHLLYIVNRVLIRQAAIKALAQLRQLHEEEIATISKNVKFFESPPSYEEIAIEIAHEMDDSDGNLPQYCDIVRQ